MKTLVIGASTNPERYSYKAINSLLNHKHEVVAIGNKTGTISGVEIRKEKKLFADVDTVTLYLSAKNQLEFYDYILELKPKRVIFNPGTENPEFFAILEKNNIQVEVACTLVLLATNQY